MSLFPQVITMLFLAQAPHEHGHGHGHGHAPAGQGKHGNPAEIEAYIERQESPERAEWQKPDEVVKALGLKSGQTACEIGPGPGYFSLRLARAVGEGGAVFAVDVEPKILDVLRERIAAAKVRNVVPVLGLPDDPLLPKGSCDLILFVNVYHHFEDGPAYLERLARALKPGGRLVNIDFHKKDLPVGPPAEQKVSRDDFVAQAQAAGLELAGEKTFLPYQYFLVLAPR